MTIDPLLIISKYFSPGTDAYNILVEHSCMVAEKAVATATNLAHMNPDMIFIREASMLHDIGIFFVDAPGLGCFGSMPYICHGYLGRELLEKEKYPRHALVSERHIGTGISIADIERHELLLPKRDMMPQSIEEKIICYADKFFSKRPGQLRQEKTFEQARKELEQFGHDKVREFEKMHALFSRKPSQETDPAQGQ